ncbi:hypothetical protein [Alistipes indistinctus]|uniref:hypothetical protein n=1 Tax=Alistipes indistinctus TaxID=626932 RepID=UPI003898D7B5
MKFSLKSEVTAKIWDPKSGRATVQTKEALQLNRYLDSIKGQMICTIIASRKLTKS